MEAKERDKLARCFQHRCISCRQRPQSLGATGWRGSLDEFRVNWGSISPTFLQPLAGKARCGVIGEVVPVTHLETMQKPGDQAEQDDGMGDRKTWQLSLVETQPWKF